jgi:hypothetical protein
MIVEIICIILLVFSISLNLFLIWYGRKLLQDLFYISDNIGGLTEEILLFDDHLKGMHEMEVFYGDETLGNLIRHSSALVDTLEDFAEISDLFLEKEEESLLEDVEIDDTETSP